jgi:N-acyl-L-homoserine lactone synthetase
MPIKTITLRQHAASPNVEDNYLIDAMHRDRARTFKDRLGWAVEVDSHGWEIDAFDTWAVNPLYLIALDAEGEYRGSLRILPTTGPNMLRDVFPQLLIDPSAEHARDWLPIESANIWESSRITGDGAFGELVIGLGEVAVAAGLTGIVTVVDKRIKRLVQLSGCKFEIVGFPDMIGGIECYALMFTDPTQLDRIREHTGIRGSVLKE